MYVFVCNIYSKPEDYQNALEHCLVSIVFSILND